MRNIAIIALSVVLAAAIVSGLILHRKYLDTKDALLSSEKNLFDLNEKFTQLNQETSALRDQIRKNSEGLKELKSAKVHTSELENAIKMKDQTLSEFKDEIVKGKSEIEGLKHQLLVLKGQQAIAETKKDQMKSTYDTLVSDLKKQIENQEVTIKAFEEKISVTFVDCILFEFSKASITPEGRKILKKVGEILKDVQGRQIRVVGHTDNIPIMPEYQYKFPSNWELSAARAAAVIRHFQKKMGLDPKNLEAVGRSFYEPIASNETREGRAQNRRVEIIISPKIK
jgi:chemotaxis protein MotB